MLNIKYILYDNVARVGIRETQIIKLISLVHEKLIFNSIWIYPPKIFMFIFGHVPHTHIDLNIFTLIYQLIFKKNLI